MAALVALQGVGLLVASGFLAVELVTARPASAASAAGSAVLALLGGLGLLAVSRGLRCARHWSRSPALVAQLLVLPVAWGLLQGDRWYVGAPLAAWALAVAGMLFVPAVSGLLSDPRA